MYDAPEVKEKNIGIGPKADIYSLGYGIYLVKGSYIIENKSY